MSGTTPSPDARSAPPGGQPANAGPALAILPYGRKLGLRPGAIPLDSLDWPLGLPERLAGGRLRDLAPTDHLLLWPRGTHHVRPGFGTRAKVSIMVMEPAAIHARHLARLRRSHRRFHRVLVHNRPLLEAIPNGLFLPYGTTWVPDWRTRDLTKTAMCSLIASGKRSQDGHRLRHRMAEEVRAEGLPVDVMGRGYRPFETKADGLAPFRYSIVIENVREPDYFSEKLIDALLCLTVPIYWGCPNIGDHVDTSGVILCDTADDIRAALAAMSEADYAARLPALEAARRDAAAFTDLEIRAARLLLSGG